MRSQGIIIANNSKDQITPYFNARELVCRCGICRRSHISLEFIRKLDAARGTFGYPLKINSFYRCYRHNLNVGGVSNSNHMFGLAADVDVSPYDSTQRKELRLICADLSLRVIEYDDFFHIDLGGSFTDIL